MVLRKIIAIFFMIIGVAVLGPIPQAKATPLHALLGWGFSAYTVYDVAGLLSAPLKAYLGVEDRSAEGDLEVGEMKIWVSHEMEDPALTSLQRDTVLKRSKDILPLLLQITSGGILNQGSEFQKQIEKVQVLMESMQLEYGKIQWSTHESYEYMTCVEADGLQAFPLSAEEGGDWQLGLCGRFFRSVNALPEHKVGVASRVLLYILFQLAGMSEVQAKERFLGEGELLI